MDLTDPTGIMVSVLLGGIGMGFFVHGKKSGNIKTLCVGLALMIGPAFISSLWGDAVLVACCGGALFLLPSGGD